MCFTQAPCQYAAARPPGGPPDGLAAATELAAALAATELAATELATTEPEGGR
ncbi:hypothetical protein [Streptomyces javensis]|uniref:Uncharacterized protein n=1 Tax=Streptomyces javensis TaxID=114698 RepID=A0ABS0R6Q3_9ACTN|nr:hypothetical protein [Streptomyces javensis]MBI0313082.1 hypothetical protein [Streptomyces javensis]